MSRILFIAVLLGFTASTESLFLRGNSINALETSSLHRKLSTTAFNAFPENASPETISSENMPPAMLSSIINDLKKLEPAIERLDNDIHKLPSLNPPFAFYSLTGTYSLAPNGAPYCTLTIHDSSNSVHNRLTITFLNGKNNVIRAFGRYNSAKKSGQVTFPDGKTESFTFLGISGQIIWRGGKWYQVENQESNNAFSLSEPNSLSNLPLSESNTVPLSGLPSSESNFPTANILSLSEPNIRSSPEPKFFASNILSEPYSSNANILPESEQNFQNANSLSEPNSKTSNILSRSEPNLQNSKRQSEPYSLSYNSLSRPEPELPTANSLSEPRTSIGKNLFRSEPNLLTSNQLYRSEPSSLSRSEPNYQTPNILSRSESNTPTDNMQSLSEPNSATNKMQSRSEPNSPTSRIVSRSEPNSLSSNTISRPEPNNPSSDTLSRSEPNTRSSNTLSRSEPNSPTSNSILDTTYPNANLRPRSESNDISRKRPSFSGIGSSADNTLSEPIMTSSTSMPLSNPLSTPSPVTRSESIPSNSGSSSEISGSYSSIPNGPVEASVVCSKKGELTVHVHNSSKEKEMGNYDPNTRTGVVLMKGQKMPFTYNHAKSEIIWNPNNSWYKVPSVKPNI